MAVREQTLPLWPDGAPGAKEDGPEDTPRITLFLPDGDTPRACVAVFPGGGYGGRAPHEGVPIARWVNTLGLAAAVVDYRVSPYRHPNPLGDAQRAIRTLRANAAEWRIDPDRIGILGFSAGGHLVTSAATIFDAGNPKADDPIERCGCRPNAFIACYPVITFDRDRHHGSMVNLLGDADVDFTGRLGDARVVYQYFLFVLQQVFDDLSLHVLHQMLIDRIEFRFRPSLTEMDHLIE